MKNPKFVHSEIIVKGKIQSVFDSLAVNGNDFPKFFKGFFLLIPPIKTISIPENTKIEVGAIRTVTLGDGSIIKERILEHNSPYLQKYEMAELSHIQKMLFINMHGKYTLSEENEIVKVNWDYTFFPKDTFLSSLIVPIVSWAFGKAMHSCLKNMKEFQEKGEGR